MTTPKFAGQTSPAVVFDGYSPTYAKGKELKDRKAGRYLRMKAGDDDDAYDYQGEEEEEEEEEGA